MSRPGEGTPEQAPATARVRVLHSTDWGYRFSPWAPRAPMRVVDSFDLAVGEEPPTEHLEHIYRAHNAVDGTERNVRLGLRSLSVGDVVIIGETAFACERFGWREIDPRELNVEGGHQGPALNEVDSPNSVIWNERGVGPGGTWGDQRTEGRRPDAGG